MIQGLKDDGIEVDFTVLNLGNWSKMTIPLMEKGKWGGRFVLGIE